MHRTLKLAGVPLMLAVTSLYAMPPAALGDIEQLLSSARLWELRHRYDLSREALQKALLIRPDQPDVLCALGEVELHDSKPGASKKILARLGTLYPNHPATQELRNEIRMATTDRQAIAMVRLLTHSGKGDEAWQKMRALFPNGAPPGALGVEYYRVEARATDGRKPALAGLQKMRRAQPDDPRPAIAVATLLAEREDTLMDSIRMAASLSRRPDVDPFQVRAIWKHAMLNAPDSPQLIPFLQQYLRQMPEDEEMHARLDKLTGHNRAKDAAPQAAADITPDRVVASLGAAPRTLTVALGSSVALPIAIRGDGAPQADAAAVGIPRLAKVTGAAPANVVSSADALTAAGEKAADAKDWPAAARLFQRAHVLDPSNPTALRRLVGALRETKQLQAAFEAVAQARSQGKVKPATLDGLEADVRRDVADRLIDAGDLTGARRELERAVALQPDWAWHRFALARLYDKLKMHGAGARVMAEGRQIADSTDMRYAQALYLSLADQPGEALAIMQTIPEKDRSDGAKSLVRKLTVHRQLAEAKAARQAGNGAAFEAAMAAATRQAGDDPDRVEDVADAWTDAGQADRGVALYQDWLDRHKDAPVDARLSYAGLLAHANRYDASARQLQALDQAVGLTTEQRKQIDKLTYDNALHQADHLADNERYVTARSVLDGVTPAHRQEPRYLLALADLCRQEKRFAEARGYAEQAIARAPDDAGARLTLARILAEAGDKAAARQQMGQILAQAKPGDLDTRLSVARRFIADHDYDFAEQLLDDLKRAHPRNPDVTVMRGRLLEAQHHYDAAMALYRQARDEERHKSPSLASDPPVNDPPAHARPASGTPVTTSLPAGAANPKPDAPVGQVAPPDPAARSSQEEGPTLGSATPAEQAMQSLESRRQPEFDTGIERLHKSGDPGVSQYDVTQVPIYGRWPVGYDGHVFFHADPTYVSAGTLPLDNPSIADEFGKVAALGATRAPSESAHGVALSVGYENDRTRWDVGTTPLGFPVQNVVGGVREKGTVSGMDYSVEASRRPVTSSFLSYAGATDPATGAVWGGVVRTGVYGRISGERPFGWTFRERPVDWSLAADGGVLTGRNVKTNQEYTLRGALDWPLLRWDGGKLDGGVSLSYWHYADNLRFYTFGQGGYYSPQHYTSLALPISVSGHKGKLSYAVRASVSVSHSVEANSPFYPNDPALQAISNQVYTGGTGTGFGKALSASLEYSLTPKLAVGGLVSVERARYYAPDQALLYLRYRFNPKGTVSAPSPVEPYSAY